MNKNILLILLVIFIFSSNLYIISDIVKGLLYILILIQLLNYFNNHSIAKSIKTIVTDVINYDVNNHSKSQNIALPLFNMIKHSNDITFSNKKFDVSFDDNINDNRNFLGRFSNNRNLYN